MLFTPILEIEVLVVYCGKISNNFFHSCNKIKEFDDFVTPQIPGCPVDYRQPAEYLCFIHE